jgi:uncharacterized Tic20 family protein
MGSQEALATTPVPTKDEQSMAFLAHFLQVFTGFVAPLVIYLIKRESRFVSFHAMQALLWQIAYLVLFFMLVFVIILVAMFATFATHPPAPSPAHAPPPTFILLFPLVWLVMVCGWVLNLVLGIVFGIKANRGEWAAYPVVGRWAHRITGT